MKRKRTSIRLMEYLPKIRKKFINRRMILETSIMKNQILKRVNNFGLTYGAMRKNMK